MADVWEKDLAQKSSLTVNDFIRVVGTDNVSYKQLVSDVAKKIIENYTGSSLAGSSQSVKSALDALNSNSSADIAISISSGTASSKTVIKRGNSINIHILISGMSAPATGTVGTLPSGYIPSGTRYLSGYVVINNARIPMCFSVSPSGNITYGYSSVQTATQIEIFGDVIL